MKIFIVILLLPVCHFEMKIVEYPIGPSFISMFHAKQRLYYNNLGTRLDCSSRGNPSPMISWFRLNNSDTRLLIPAHPSQFIEIFENGSLFIRPFQDYYKAIHATSYICQAKNPAGSIQSLPIEIKPQIHDAHEIEVKNPYGFLQSSVIISCEISPPIASSYVNIIGWLEKVNNQINELDLRIGTKYNLLTNKNLIIHNVSQSDDDRSYACMIQNQIDNQTKTSRFKTLRVRNRSPFGPELSIPNNTEYNAQSGDLIELPCGIASYSSNAQISWWKDGKQIANNQDYLILQLSFSVGDSGIYSCQVEDESIGRLTSAMSLKVHYPLKCQMDIQNTDISAGSNQQLICSINSLLSTSDHWQWYHNSLPLSTKLNRYTITNATRKHMGMYQCCSDICCAQKQIRIINSPPFLLPAGQIHRNSIIIIPKTIANISIDLNCTIYGHPSPDINVYKDGEKLPFSNNQIEYLPSGDLFLHYRIRVSSSKDTGLYECRAKNSFGSISFSKHINIEDQKPVIASLIDQTKRANEEFTVFCYASGQPHLSLQWRDESTNQIMNTSSISPVILTTKSSRSTIYSCEAKNSFGEISSKMLVKIENPARILSLTSNQTMKIHQSFEVHCFADGDSPFELTLRTPLMKKRYENRRNLSFTIGNLQLTDSGLYTCQVKNNYSEDQASFEILVQDVPGRIEHIRIENSERISWKKPLDGNAEIFKYILRIRSKQNANLRGFSWSNETNIFIENLSITSYSFENIYSECTLLISIQTENTIGLSEPSNAVQLQIKSKQLSVAPYNIRAVNISDGSVRLSWQYPFLSICDESKMKFIIEIFDPVKQTRMESSSTDITIDRLRSFTFYSFAIYAVNELGPSPKSKSLKIQTSESVPLVMITEFTGYLLNNSSASLSWMLNPKDFSLLNGKFRTYSLTIYENFNMSTLTTIETIHSTFLLSNLHSSSQYFISVSICNYFDCGSSSSVLILQTSASTNRSLSTTKPSSIRAKLHFTKSNEIGLKILYPSESIETLIISYKIQNSSITKQMNISPPVLNIRLNNLLCGNIYEITIHTSNQMGISESEYLIAKTDGSVPSLTDAKDLFETISHNYILLNMSKWLINECPILFYEIEINSTRYASSKSRYQISNLQADEIYQMNLRVSSEAGEIREEIFFRTTDDYERIRVKNEQLILIMSCIATLFLTLTCVCVISKFCVKKDQSRRLKPVVHSKKNQRYYPKIEHDLTIENYRSDSFTSEDSQGNINPYAVTGPTAIPSERYFCPIILESSTRPSNKPFLNANLSTISSSADSGVHSAYQDNPFYETYDQTVHSPQYSLV